MDKKIEPYVCPICHNSDPLYIGYKQGSPYCRRCISFKGRVVDDNFEIIGDSKLVISYNLTPEQERISKEITENFKQGIDQLVVAVCGAGKTELVFDVISYALKNKLKVGFAVPRKDVVMELSNRFSASFKDCKVVAVYGGHTSFIEGDIICLTTHQLYRYNRYFDLLIMDEIDAFPYKDNDLLITMFQESVKGSSISMTASASDKLIEKYSKDGRKVLTLYTRYHLHPLPVPKIVRIPSFVLKVAFLVKKLQTFIRRNQRTIIFVPRVSDAEFLYLFIRPFIKDGYFVHSRDPRRIETVQNLRDNKLKYVVATAVLERGVTFPGLNVIVYNADNNIYGREALLQISGRVGRSKDCPTGEVYFLCDKKTEGMVKAIDKTNEANKHLQALLQRV